MKKLLLSAATLISFLMPCAAKAEIKAVTAILPPYTLLESEMPGIGHEIVEEISKRSGVAINIEYMQWKQAQEVAKTTPNTLVFGLTRTESREPNYMWVTKLFDSSDVFVTNSKPVNSYEEAKQLSKIAVMGGTPRDKSLVKNEVLNTEIIGNEVFAERMLKGGKVDGWYTLDHRAAYIWKKEGNKLSDLVIGSPVKTQEIWLAANKEMPAEDIEKIKAAMETIRTDGTYDTIANKYIGE